MLVHRDRGLLCSGIGRGSIVGRAPVEGVPQIRGCVKSTLNFTVTRRYRVPANRSIERSRSKKENAMTGDPGRIDGSKPSRCRAHDRDSIAMLATIILLLDYAQTISNFDSFIPPCTNNYFNCFSPSKN